MSGRIHAAAARAGAAILLLAAGAGLIAGCSSDSNSNSSGAASNAQYGPGAAPQAANGDAQKAPSAAGSGQGSGSGSGSGSSAPKVADTSNLIIMAGLQLGVKNPEQAAAQAEQSVVADGGYVAAQAEGVGPQTLPSANASADNTESSDTGVSPVTLPTPSASPTGEQVLLLLRVPPDQLDNLIGKLSGVGKVSYQTRSATDVTGQIADVGSRITSAQDSITELRGMIDKAADMNDLIALEQALASRESDLESVQARQRALADQTTYATLTVGYFPPAPAAAAVPAAHHNAFVAGLLTGWHALLDVFHVLLVVVGWALPFAVPLALLWWLVRRLRRRSGGGGEGSVRTWWRKRAEHRTE